MLSAGFAEACPFACVQVPLSPLSNAKLTALNARLITQLQLPLSENALAFANGQADYGNKPYATVYAGHQFGQWAGRLGDGRATMLGQWQDPQQQRWEIQLKGAGLTPFSRMGDGKAVWRSSIREYLASEFMQALGIPTTEALALVVGSDAVYRERIEQAAIVTRVAPSFIRFGHFEYFHYAQQPQQLRQLADYVIAHFYPQCQGDYGQFFAQVCERTAHLIAAWQASGFCHGVMNTDNMSILGLTIDYGPFAWLDDFDARFICNHSDDQGRYAYDQQPGIALWNLQCLARALSSLISNEQAEQGFARYIAQLEASYLQRMRARFALDDRSDDDWTLISDYLQQMQDERRDYHASLYLLAKIDLTNNVQPLLDHFIDRERIQLWLRRYQQRINPMPEAQRQQQCQQHNPHHVLRNYLAEQAIRAAEAGDWQEFEQLNQAINQPFHAKPQWAKYAALPPDWGKHLEISCSS